MGTSPVVQSLEICLPMQGVWIGSLFGKLRCRVHLSQLSLHATSGEATHSRAHASQQKKSVPRATVVCVDPRLESRGSAGKTGFPGMD